MVNAVQSKRCPERYVGGDSWFMLCSRRLEYEADRSNNMRIPVYELEHLDELEEQEDVPVYKVEEVTAERVVISRDKCGSTMWMATWQVTRLVVERLYTTGN
jgi:hypothetical protein